VLAGAADLLAYGRLGGLQDVRDLRVRVVERLPQHVRRPFLRGELLHQHEHGQLQRLAALGAQERIGAGVDRFG
jgi:hypothetical protein